MADKYLNKNGLSHLIDKLKSSNDKKVDKEEGKMLSSNDFTDTEKAKLAGISEGANNYTLPSAGASLGGVKSGGDVTISGGVITVNDDSHNHTIANVDGLQTALNGKAEVEHGHKISDVNGLQTALDNVSGETESALSEAKTYADTKSATALSSAKSYTDTTAATTLSSAKSYADTKAETALSSAKSYTDGEIDTIAELLEEGLETKANASDLTAHVNNKSNPHGVTLSQLGVTATAAELNKMDGVTATTAELNYVDGVTSNIQTQLNAKAASSSLTSHTGNKSNPHGVTAAQVGLGNVNNTADADKPVSTAQASAISTAKGEAVAAANDYTDGKVADLINSAPSTLDTLGEIATAMEENADVVEALNEAIGTKANISDIPDVIDNLTSTAKTDALSAYQGKVLNDKISTINTSLATKGSGDMLKSVYDTDGDGIVDNAEKLGGQLPSYYAKASDIPTKTSQLTNDSGFKTTDNNTTYSISKSGSTITLTGSDGSTTSVTDSNTTYSAAGSSLGLVKSGGDVSISDGVITVNDDSHNHVISNVDGLQTALDSKVDKVDGKGLSTNDYTTTEKTKLSGIATGAEVNQNAFSNVVVGSTTIAADVKTDTLTLAAGSNVTITPDATNDKITIAATDTTYSQATSSTAGLVKIGYTESGKNYPVELNSSGQMYVNVPWTDNNTVYTHPTYTAKSSGLYKVTVDGTGHVSGTAAVAKADITALGIPAQDTTYSAATTSAAGLMSSTDKSKLDGIASGANKTTVDSSLSSTSTNPVQNKVINTALAGKADLDSNGKVPSSQLPSYVDDVLEYTAKSDFPTTGETGKIYIDTSTNKTYRWSGSTYAEISASLAIGTTSSTAAAGNHTHGSATTSAAGFMSSTDKSKLDGIATNANNYSLPTASSSTLGGVKTTSTVTSTSGLTACPIISGVPYYKDTNTTYTHPTSSGNKHIPSGGSSGQILRWSADGTAVWGNDNNTTYSAATTSTDGLMSSSDKTKLNGIATGAEVNQNAFSNITVGSTTIAADSKADTLTLAGSNVTITPDATNDKVTIGITKDNVTAALGYTPPTTNTTYSAATTSAAGLMSASDKSKLDGIASGANAYTHPSSHPASMITGLATVATSGSYNDLSNKPTIPTVNNATLTIQKNGSNVATFTANSSTNATANITVPTKTSELTNDSGFKTTDNNTTYTLTKSGSTITLTGSDGSTTSVADSNTTYSAATTSANGLMSSSDKSKLDGIATGANKTTVDSSLSTGSTNPVQNNVVTTELNKKAYDYCIELYNGTGGNPKPVKFATVNYSTCNSEAGVAAKIGMVSGHGNGSSYAFLQDAIIKVNFQGAVQVDNFKYYGADTGTYDGANRQYGDIFWVVDTTNKIVDFYCLMGQYARVNMTPWKRLTYSSGGTVTQYTSCTVYSSGTKVWANNSNIALKNTVVDLSSNQVVGGNKVFTGTTSTMILHTYNPLYINNGTDNAKSTSLYTNDSNVFAVTSSAGSMAFNGKTVALTSDIPTKTSQLTNDSGFKTTDNNTTYTLTQSDDNGKYTFADSNGNSTVIGEGGIAMGQNAKATAGYTFALGFGTTASGQYSFAAGRGTNATGNTSIALGLNTTASGYVQMAAGRYNTVSDGPTSAADTSGSLVVVGNGTAAASLSNAFRVATNGTVYGVGAYRTTGADYAEYFEWADGNPDDEDRRGYFVTLDGDKIRKANADDIYILGVISAFPSTVGDTQSENWQGKYLTDVYGDMIVEVVDVEETVETDEFGDETVIPAHTEHRWVLNPDYDPEQEYISREYRKEWDAVGLLGKLVVNDDGTCEVNGFCKVDNDGKATASDTITRYRVMNRIDDTHIRIMFSSM